MISSESINFSKYSKINDNNQSNDLEIIETKEKSIKKEEKEDLSQNLIVSNETQNEISGKNGIKYKLGNLYGNPYEELNPKYIGKSLALFFDKYGNPRITIGPDCKYITQIIFYY
jgi:hypothetical protein